MIMKGMKKHFLLDSVLLTKVYGHIIFFYEFYS